MKKKGLSLFLVMLLMLSTLAVLPAGAAEDEATVILAANAYDDESASGNSKSYDFENGQTFSNTGAASYTFTPSKTGWYRVGVYNDAGRTFSQTSDTEVNTEKTYYTLNESREYEAVAEPESSSLSSYWESALANDSTTFGVTAKIGEESRSRSGFGVSRANTWWYYSDVGEYYNNVGGFKLTANEEVTLTLSFNLSDTSKSVQIRDITVQYMPDIEVSATGDTKIVAASYADGVIPRADQMMYAVFSQEKAPEGTNSDDWKGTVVGSTESTLLYNLNVSEAGYYSLSSLTSDSWNHCTVYDNGEQIMVDKFAGVTQSGELGNPVWSQLGIMYLTAGQHELKIVHYGGIYIFGFKLAPYHKTIDATEKTPVQIYKDFVTATYREDEAGNSWGEPYHLSQAAAGALNELTDGYLIADSDDSMTYVVEAEDAGLYRLSMVLGNGANQNITVQVNDGTKKTMTWKASGITDFSSVTSTRQGKTSVGQFTYAHESELGTIYLNKGQNTVKFTVNGSMYLYSWSLERTKLNSVAAAGCDTISTLNYSGYYIGTESNPPDAVVLHDTYWFTYTLNVAEAGTYKLITRGPANNTNLGDAYGNVTNLTTDMTYFNEGKQLIKNQTDLYTVGEIYLAKGTNELKFTFSGISSTYWYSFKLERVATNVPAAGATVNTVEASRHFSTNGSTDEFHTTENPSFVVARENYWFEYTLNMAEAGLYKLSTVKPEGGYAGGDAIGSLTNVTTGETYFTDTLIQPAACGEHTIGTIYLKKGYNLLRFDIKSASTYWYSFKLKSVPVEKLYNTPAGGTKAEATAVADGTMSVSVTMPSDCTAESLAVIFAIYQDGRLYKAASDPTAVASADTPIELSIENVATEAGSTYSYRVFYWNDMTNLQPLY